MFSFIIDEWGCSDGLLGTPNPAIKNVFLFLSFSFCCFTVNLIYYGCIHINCWKFIFSLCSLKMLWRGRLVAVPTICYVSSIMCWENLMCCYVLKEPKQNWCSYFVKMLTMRSRHMAWTLPVRWAWSTAVPPFVIRGSYYPIWDFRWQLIVVIDAKKPVES